MTKPESHTKTTACGCRFVLTLSNPGGIGDWNLNVHQCPMHEHAAELLDMLERSDPPEGGATSLLIAKAMPPHTHVGPNDKCGRCGKDLRHPIHQAKG